jgi:CheY-like chemotaxis protein
METNMLSTQQIPKLILVVEDDADISCFLLHLLEEEAQYQVALATDSLQALKMVETLTPSLLMLNYLLPHMNGIQLYDRLHTIEKFQNVPAIMLSANLPREEVKKRGIIGLDKPIDVDELLDTIEQLISSSEKEVPNKL